MDHKRWLQKRRFSIIEFEAGNLVVEVDGMIIRDERINESIEEIKKLVDSYIEGIKNGKDYA